MGGPNLEIFKFGFYLFTPIYVMVKFGDPDWYDEYVRPYKERFWPPYETTHQTPKSHSELKEELTRMKAERLARKQASTTITPSSSSSSSMSASTSTQVGESETIPSPAEQTSIAQAIEATPVPPTSTFESHDVQSHTTANSTSTPTSRWTWPGSSANSGNEGGSSWGSTTTGDRLV
ncbi:hypothetical protein IAR55_004374 [Kwoniella newhampshirensis]|uniref:Uncharacterized protein n=1 Tax=Kwoniella newhampshirensis TaxID=1651941 RepID=A0AAW0YXR6_9TREE